MRGIVMIRGQAYVQLLDDINIKDPEAIRRVVRQAVTLPPIDEVAKQGIKICVSGPMSSLLGTSTLSLTWVEQQAANDIQKLWKRGERYQVHIKRLIQDCDVTKADFLVVKGVESARKFCLQAQDEERKNEEDRSLVQPDAEYCQDLFDKEDDQKLPRTPSDAYKQVKRSVTDHLREGSTPNKRQERNQSDAVQSLMRSVSTEIQDFDNQESRIEFTPVNKPGTNGINNSEKQSGKPKNTPGTRMVNSLRDHNAVSATKSGKKKQTSVRLTRNSLKRGENSGIGTNEIVPSLQFNSRHTDSTGSQNPSNALTKELADHNKRGENEGSSPIGRIKERQYVEQQPEPIIGSENDVYTPQKRTTPYKRKGGHGGARRGLAWEKRRSGKENDDRSSSHRSQEDQLGSESNPIGIGDGSDNETGVHGQLDNQEEDVEMKDMQ
ncbi:uncharacterized protein Bfra_002808 [Botrytis fragariae]|uniref:Uncharacterized protein n=1 Tax=Botrytis fragariae TaxID=1964551 RepID=A0A8H6ELD1_9HELO|nr:uncharacterized protein Bfra_002808 [Botrytis fragariae]KAF5876404.1 hypothetical protein Bfra_002808 [Botrytis fragariae]